MKDDKEKWIDDVFNSLEGSQRAKPNRDLFAKIEAEIENTDSGAKIIPLAQIRMMAAAAIVLLALNVAVVFEYTQSYELSGEKQVAEMSNNESLISNYNLYD